MINKIDIKNYKSIVDLELELGRVNVIVGANGSGKSNILEAIALASAANQDRLDNDYLRPRVRLTEPNFMYSEFEDIDEDVLSQVITIKCKGGSVSENSAYLFYSEDNEWVNIGKKLDRQHINKVVTNAINKSNDPKIVNVITSKIKELDNYEDIETLFEEVKNDPDYDIVSKIPNYSSRLQHNWFRNTDLSSFLIYAPEESNLRKFEDETMISPLGRRGEGLFKHLKELISDNENGIDMIEALNEGLSLLDWFEEFEIPDDLFTEERRLNITDRFLKETANVFDQRSTNEGFLFLLFYLTLFNSPKTPAFFAIDNIESALNPKLARKLITHLIKVAKEKDKQVIFTTHSPYVLDGLDLSDDEQRLFVVQRNIDGHTNISRVPYRENRKGSLSEIWMKGYIGGLPDNF